MFYRLGQAMIRLRYWVIGVWFLAVILSLPFAPRVAEASPPAASPALTWSRNRR